MSDLIVRQAAIDLLKKAYWNNDIQSAKDDPCIIDAMIDWAIRQIKSVPAIEAEPVKHGKWLIGVGENGEPIGTYCSECGWSWERNIAAIQLNKVLSLIKTPRCPYCGAKMDE